MQIHFSNLKQICLAAHPAHGEILIYSIEINLYEISCSYLAVIIKMLSVILIYFIYSFPPIGAQETAILKCYKQQPTFNFDIILPCLSFINYFYNIFKWSYNLKELNINLTSLKDSIIVWCLHLAVKYSKCVNSYPIISNFCPMSFTNLKNIQND